MKKFKIVVSFSLIIIFLAMFFIHYSLNNFFITAEACSVSTGAICSGQGMQMILVFTFLMVMAFIIVIETTLFFIFKEIEIEVIVEATRAKKDIKSKKDLIRKKKEIEKSKADVRRKYFRREIEESTFKNLKESYDRDIVEIEALLKRKNLKIDDDYVD